MSAGNDVVPTVAKATLDVVGVLLSQGLILIFDFDFAAIFCL